eukprot:2162552-Rhodomonas_salina.1
MPPAAARGSPSPPGQRHTGLRALKLCGSFFAVQFCDAPESDNRISAMPCMITAERPDATNVK